MVQGFEDGEEEGKEISFDKIVTPCDDLSYEGNGYIVDKHVHCSYGKDACPHKFIVVMKEILPRTSKVTGKQVCFMDEYHMMTVDHARDYLEELEDWYGNPESESYNEHVQVYMREI